ncbi:MAG: hypothetical protein R3C68_16880 [Myxococcota bacterium]
MTSSLWAALVDSCGEDPRLVHELVDIFAWDIDFYSEVYMHDTFRLLVEKRFVRDQFLEYGPVLAAEYVSGGDVVHRAFMQKGEDGIASYYDAEGQSLQKQLLKAPLKYANITSALAADAILSWAIPVSATALTGACHWHSRMGRGGWTGSASRS